MKKILPIVCLAMLFSAQIINQADTVSKKYRISYNRSTDTPSLEDAESEAKKLLIQDDLKEKFSPEIMAQLKEKIASAIDTPDRFLISYDLLGESLNRDETQRILEIEGEVDTASVIGILAQKKLLTFGQQAPKVMLLSSAETEYQKATTSLRARIFQKLSQAGLHIVDENTTQTLNIRSKTPPSSRSGQQTIVRQSKEYGADYLIAITTQVDAKSVLNGYSTDVNLTYTVSRPNSDSILGEGTIKGHSSGASQMVAFDKTFDKIAPVFAMRATGDLYKSIFSDSDIIYSTPQLRQDKTIIVNWADSPTIQAIIRQLEQTGATVTLGTGMSSASSRLHVSTNLSDLELYKLFNSQTVSVGGKAYTTPVVAYAENVIEIEALAPRAIPRKKPVSTPPQPQPKPGPQVAILEVKLRSRQYNR